MTTIGKVLPVRISALRRSSAKRTTSPAISPAVTLCFDIFSPLPGESDVISHVIQALIALSPSANGFTASDLAARVRLFSKQGPLQYGPRHAASDLKKLRGKQIVQRVGRTRRYQTPPPGLRAMAALVVLRNKAIKPLLAAALPLRPTRGASNPRPIDTHYRAIQVAMQGVFHELGLAACPKA